MSADKDYQLSYRRLMMIVAIAIFGWVIPFGIANYKFDQCSNSLQARLDTMKARIDGIENGIEKK
jgi:hypothetical protein